jgi:hypothetical protein
MGQPASPDCSLRVPAFVVQGSTVGGWITFAFRAEVGAQNQGDETALRIRNKASCKQTRRPQTRLDDPKKYWNVNPEYVNEREYWDDYMPAYKDLFRHCSKKHAPRYIIPANQNWY